MFPEGKRGGFKARGRRGRVRVKPREEPTKDLSTFSDETGAGQDIDKGDELKLRNDVPRGFARGEKQE